jgi:hypothetical protein
LGFDQITSARRISPNSSIQRRAYRHGSPSSDLAGTPSWTLRGTTFDTPLCRPPVIVLDEDCGPGVAPVAYLSPRFSQIDPDGLSTRIHSRVQAIRLSM